MTEQPTPETKPDPSKVTIGGLDGGQIAAGATITATDLALGSLRADRLTGSSEDLALEAVRMIERQYVSALDVAKAQVFATLSVRAAIVETATAANRRALAVAGVIPSGDKPAEDIEREVKAEVARKTRPKK